MQCMSVCATCSWGEVKGTQRTVSCSYSVWFIMLELVINANARLPIVAQAALTPGVTCMQPGLQTSCTIQTSAKSKHATVHGMHHHHHHTPPGVSYSIVVAQTSLVGELFAHATTECPRCKADLSAAKKASRCGQSLSNTRTSAFRQLWPALWVMPAMTVAAWYSRSDWLHWPGHTMYGVTQPSSAVTSLVCCGSPVCSVTREKGLM